jgi:integral membrane protein (TIGR01906 family)
MTLSAEDPTEHPLPPAQPATDPEPATGSTPQSATGSHPDPAADAAAAEAAARDAAAMAEAAQGAAVDAAAPPAPEADQVPDTSPASDPAQVAAAAARAAAEAAVAAHAAAARVASAPADEASALAAQAAAAAAAASEAARIALEAARSLGADVPGPMVPATASGDAAALAGAPADDPTGPVTHVIPMPAPVAPPRESAGRRVVGAIAAAVVGLATAFTILGLSVLVLFNPIWVSSEQQRVESGTLTGYGPDELRFVTTSILLDMIVGPPDFDVQVGGTPVLNEREVAHLRDVRTAFVIFGVVALVSLVVLLLARFATHGSKAFFRRVRRGARATAIATVLVGVFAVLAFGPAFELFHELLFPAGSFTFDPETDRLVQLFPEQFWTESTVVLGVVIIVASVAFARWAESRIAEPKPGRLSARGAIASGRPAG